MAERDRFIRFGARRQTSLSSFSKLLDALNARVNQVKDTTGEQTTKTEVVNMLIAEFVTSDPSQDFARIRRYRLTKESELPNSDPPKTT